MIENSEYNSRLVTVYLITYNRASFLQRAIKSVLEQSYSNFELIVVDDASTDETETIMNELALNNKKLTYIRLTENMGANHARNVAINKAKGYYITGLDDDDEMLPERIKKMVNAYDDKYAFIVSEHYLDYGKYRKYKSLTTKQYLSLDDLLYANLVGNQILTTKINMIKAGSFDEKIKAAQDHDMWIRLLQNGQRAKIIKEALQVIYIGHDSITMSKNKFSGYFQVYNKYKKSFSKEQRKYWLLNFYYWRDKRISCAVALKLLPRHFKYFFISIAKVIKVNKR